MWGWVRRFCNFSGLFTNAPAKPVILKKSQIKLRDILIEALNRNDTEAILGLIPRISDINGMFHKNTITPLHMAASRGNLQVVNALLGARAIVNVSRDGLTPLYLASQNGHAQVVRALLAGGANVNHARNDGMNPLFAASQNGHAQVVEALLTGGAKVDQAIRDKYTPLFIAAELGHAQVVEALLAGGANADQVIIGRTPLYVACCNGHVQVVEALLRVNPRIIFANRDSDLTNVCIIIDSKIHQYKKTITDILSQYAKKQNGSTCHMSSPVGVACGNFVKERPVVGKHTQTLREDNGVGVGLRLVV